MQDKAPKFQNFSAEHAPGPPPQKGVPSARSRHLAGGPQKHSFPKSYRSARAACSTSLLLSALLQPWSSASSPAPSVVSNNAVRQIRTFPYLMHLGHSVQDSQGIGTYLQFARGSTSIPYLREVSPNPWYLNRSTCLVNFPSISSAMLQLATHTSTLYVQIYFSSRQKMIFTWTVASLIGKSWPNVLCVYHWYHSRKTITFPELDNHTESHHWSLYGQQNVFIET